GMWGLGDNILQRPFIRALTRRRQIYLETPWPELYRGINNLIFVEGRRELRTQLKNIARQNGSVWRPAPPGLDRITIGYGYQDFAIGTSIDAMERMMPLEGEPFVYELPDFGPAPVDSGGRPIAVIRPATVRKEWRNEARNPLPE